MLQQKNCKVCNEPTPVGFNINLKLVPICEDCATSIFIQQAKSYATNRDIFIIGERFKPKPKDKHEAEVLEVTNYLYDELLGKRKYPDWDSLPKPFQTMLAARIEEGYTVKQLKAVAFIKYKEWRNDPRMVRHIKADTLYRPKNFPRYLAEVPEDYNPTNTQRQREILRKLNRYITTGERNEESAALVEELKLTGFDKPNILKQFK